MSPPVTKVRPILRNWPGILITIVSTLVAIGATEFAFRTLLFSDFSVMQRFRDPGLYADYFSDDAYWLLYHRFGGVFKPPERPHPTLGWVGSFDRTTFRHQDADQVGSRRPVLLYGDSFAACTDTPCFQDILNQDPASRSGATCSTTAWEDMDWTRRTS